MRHSKRIEAARERVRKRGLEGNSGNMAYIGALEHELRQADLDIVDLEAGHALARIELDQALTKVGRENVTLRSCLERARYAVDES
jgi:adenylosuccinate lyase